MNLIEKGFWLNVLKKSIFFTVIIGLVAIMQTYSLWLPIDEKVDESELVYYAIGFFGGDLNPHWYGYGSIGMYLLSFIYIISYPINYLFTNITSFEEYSLLLFSSNYFIEYGRFIFSIIGIITSLVYLGIIAKVSKNLLIIIFFTFIYFTSYDSIYYSNYIRSDQLVALFVSLVIFLTIYINKKNYYILSIVIGATIAAKISSIAIGGLFLYSSYLLLKNKKINFLDFCLASIILIVSAQLLQPYNNLFSFLTMVVSDNNPGTLDFYTKLYTFYSTLIISIKQNININIIYSLILLPFTFKYYLRIVLIVSATFLLLLLPYLAGNGVIRNYWLISNYDIIYFMSALSVVSFFRFLDEYINKKAINNLALLVVLIGLTYTIYTNLLQYKYIISVYQNKQSNKKIAEDWIENNLIKKDNITIYMDMHKNYNLPKVYNKNNVDISTKVTRDFIYNRHQNKYLKEIFSKYINQYYVENLNVKYSSLELLRIDPLSSIKDAVKISNLKIFYLDKEIKYEIVKTNHIDNIKIYGVDMIFDTIGNDPYFVIKPLAPVYLDSTFKIEFYLEGKKNDRVFVFFDIGKGFNSNISISKPNNYKFKIEKVHLADKKRYAKVLPLRASVVDDKFKSKFKDSYFITSPSIYESFINKDTYKAGHLILTTPTVFDSYYKYMSNRTLFKRFDSGYGNVIEVFKID